MPCYDIEGNSVDCGGTDAIGIASPSYSGDVNSGLDLTSNPVAASSVGNSGGTSLLNASFFSNLFSFGTQAIKSFSPTTSPSSGLRLQTNPSTGQLQYFNPSTGQYVGGAVNANSGGLFSGNSSMLLVVFALIVGFFAFSGKGKRLLAA